MDKPGQALEMARVDDGELGFGRNAGWHKSIIKDAPYRVIFEELL